jgi:hypothetical protein
MDTSNNLGVFKGKCSLHPDFEYLQSGLQDDWASARPGFLGA